MLGATDPFSSSVSHRMKRFFFGQVEDHIVSRYQVAVWKSYLNNWPLSASAKHTSQTKNTMTPLLGVAELLLQPQQSSFSSHSSDMFKYKNKTRHLLHRRLKISFSSSTRQGNHKNKSWINTASYTYTEISRSYIFFNHFMVTVDPEPILGGKERIHYG